MLGEARLADEAAAGYQSPEVLVGVCDKLGLRANIDFFAIVDSSVAGKTS